MFLNIWVLIGSSSFFSLQLESNTRNAAKLTHAVSVNHLPWRKDWPNESQSPWPMHAVALKMHWST